MKLTELTGTKVTWCLVITFGHHAPLVVEHNHYFLFFKKRQMILSESLVTSSIYFWSYVAI